jgi:hypothetical protein
MNLLNIKEEPPSDLNNTSSMLCSPPVTQPASDLNNTSSMLCSPPAAQPTSALNNPSSMLCSPPAAQPTSSSIPTSSDIPDYHSSTFSGPQSHSIPNQSMSLEIDLMFRSSQSFLNLSNNFIPRAHNDYEKEILELKFTLEKLEENVSDFGLYLYRISLGLG